jgi:hypothetical protein
MAGTTNTRGIPPDQHGPLVVQPFLKVSTAAMVATTVVTSAKRHGNLPPSPRTRQRPGSLRVPRSAAHHLQRSIKRALPEVTPLPLR